MKKWLRPVTLAAFCAVWGFLGAWGALWVMHDELQGEPGPVGEIGQRGPAGAAGPQGPAGELTTREKAGLSLMTTTIGSLDRRLDSLERTDRSDSCDVLTQVVTGISSSPYSGLSVQKSGLICLSYP